MAKKQTTLQVDVLTIFPEMIGAYCDMSILGRAQKNKLLKVKAHDLRKWGIDKHGHVDDRPFGGGVGMLMRVEPFYRALVELRVRQSASPKVRGKKRTADVRGLRTRVVLTSAKGKMFTQQEAQRLAKYDRLVFLCGRYEGVDERVAEKLADEEMCIGPYVLTGGELAAMVMTDAIIRLRPGVLGKQESLDQESWTDGIAKEYPQYTRPEVYNKWKVPAVLLSGDHKKIAEWRRKNQG
jgi:tRNA (guanine37-N1)-methyltransferase